MSNILRIVNFLRNQANLQHGAGATDAELRDLELAWGNALPDDYAAFLKTFGWVAYGSTEVAGLGQDVPTHLNVARMANTRWEDSQFPEELLPIHDSGAGWFYCLRKQSPAVVLWAHEYGQNQPYDETYLNWTQWFQGYLIDP
ncbi:MAG: SMI1/KNR4 family protein [bacterium]|nr:SMI1/KNR4 family protein [bacterium]